MKIGVLTFWWNKENYGQILQLFALKKYLEIKGHEVFLIKYDKRKEKHDKEKISLRKKISKTIVFFEIFFHRRYFEFFKKKNIYKNATKVYSSHEELKKTPPRADIYMVGSDQVWNYNLYERGAELKSYGAYFLDFGNEEIKRLTYASSWGINSLSENHIKTISPLLNKFLYISVREKEGADLCKKCGYSSCEVVNDPVFLLTADDYRILFLKNNRYKKYRNYLLLYILSDTNGFELESVYKFAKEKNLDVYCVTNYGQKNIKNKIYPKIEEWLYLIDNADYVITNSFHCSAFSIIFHKKFGVISLTGTRANTNNRFTSLFDNTKSGNHFITDKDFSNIELSYNPIVNNNLNFLNYIK